jgi:hypothetical protein
MAPPAETTEKYLARRLLDSLLDRMASGERDITLDDLLKYKLITDLLGSDSRAGPQPQKTGSDVDELMKYAVLMKMLGGQEAVPQEFRRELENLRREFNETMRTIMEKKTFDEALDALAEKFEQEVQQLREAVDEKVSELKASVPREEKKEEEETLDKMLAKTLKEKMKDKIGELIERGLFKEEEVYTQTPTGQTQVNWAKVIDKVIQLADTFGKYYTAAKVQPPPPPGREPEVLAGPPNPWPEPEPAAKPAQAAEPQHPVDKVEQAEMPPEAVEEAEEPQYASPESEPYLAVSEPQEQAPSPEVVNQFEPAKAPHRRKKRAEA